MATAEEYSWRNQEILLAGRTLVNCEEFKYERSAETEVFYGTDGEPSGWGQGEIKGEGSLKVSGQEHQHILDFATAQGYDLLKMPPIPIVVVQKSNDLPTVTHVLSAVKFTKTGIDTKNKEKRFLHDLPFVLVGGVKITKS